MTVNPHDISIEDVRALVDNAIPASNETTREEYARRVLSIHRRTGESVERVFDELSGIQAPTGSENRPDDEKPVFTEVIAPSHWASGLINNDWSSLSLSDDGEAEYERAMAFVASLPGPVVGLPEELGFKATPYWTDTPDELAQDFSRYTVQVLRPSSDMASRGGPAPSDPSADDDATDEVLGPPTAARPKGPGLGG